MLENVVFAILAIGFLYLSVRPENAKRDKSRWLPFIGWLYRAAFIVCVWLAISQSFNVTNAVTSFTYNYSNPALPITSANTVYAYSNQTANQQFALYALGLLVFLQLLSIVLELLEDSYNYGMENIGRVFNGK